MLRRSLAAVASLAAFTPRASSASARLSSSVARGWGRRSAASASALRVRGGGESPASSSTASRSSSSSSSSSSESSETKWTKLADPAPGSPFHHAFPVHDLEEAKKFYGGVLGCAEGRSSDRWQDYSLHGHQIVCHWVGNDYRCVDYTNPVDGDAVPVPHFGLDLTLDEFHALADRVRAAGVRFVIEPHLRFEGMPGEQWTMFFKDPSGNNLEFKSMTSPENLFAKYNVVEKED